MIEESYDFNYIDIIGLACWLGFDRFKRIIHYIVGNMIVIVFLEALIVVTKLDDISKLFYTLPIILFITLLIPLIFQNYNKRKLKYYNILDNYYKNFLSDYEGYSRIIVGFKNTSINNKENQNFIMLTNGYNFIFIADPLKGTRYYFKDDTNLKVTRNDYDYRLEFSTTNIKQFYIVQGFEISQDKLYNTFIDMESNIKKIIITLDDFTTIEVSGNAYEYFSKSNPLKEIKYEKQWKISKDFKRK